MLLEYQFSKLEVLIKDSVKINIMILCSCGLILKCKEIDFDTAEKILEKVMN